MTVHQLATAHVHHGWSAHELHWQFPHLSVAAIYAGLAYYYDHREAVDVQAEEADSLIEDLARKVGGGPSRHDLEARARERGLKLGSAQKIS